MNSPPIDLTNQPLKSLDHYYLSQDIYREDLAGTLITEGEISSRVEQLAEDISKKYYPCTFFALCITNGAIKFYSDLLYNRHMWAPFEVGTQSARSYQGTESTGKVTLGNHELSRLQNKEVIIVEDIIDTGRTLHNLTKKIKEYGPKNIEIACLLNKPEKRLPEHKNIHIDYCGFIISDLFVVGQGLDYNNHYRCLNHLCVLKEEVYQK